MQELHCFKKLRKVAIYHCKLTHCLGHLSSRKLWNGWIFVYKKGHCCVCQIWCEKIMFTDDVFVQQHGAVVHSIISSCLDSEVSYWMKAMTQTLPQAMATYLHMICCTHCRQDGCHKESLSHFLSTFSKFLHAWTAAHNQVCKVFATKRSSSSMSSLVSQANRVGAWACSHGCGA